MKLLSTLQKSWLFVGCYHCILTRFIPVDTEAPSKDSLDITGNKAVYNDDLLTEKYTSTNPSSSVKLDELGSSSTVATDTQNKTLVLDHELHRLSLERKQKNSKAKVKKPVCVSQYKLEPWMLQVEDPEMPRQLNLAIVGHVDSGKSTLCCRLLHALGRISKKQTHKYEKETKEKFELHIHHAKVSASLVKIVSLLDQKTGKASKKIPRLLTARQAAIIELK